MSQNTNVTITLRIKDLASKGLEAIVHNGRKLKTALGAAPPVVALKDAATPVLERIRQRYQAFRASVTRSPVTIAVRVVGQHAMTMLEGTAGRVRKAFFSLQGQLAGLGLSLTGAALGGYLVKVNAEYGRLLTQLETFEGSSKAARAVFDQLSDFAARTPFQITELVEAYATLKTAGITPTLETLTAFGDQSSAMGRKINEFADAVRSATTGEFMPLRTFGVNMIVEGDKLIASFQGVRTTIGRDAKSIVEYLQTIGSTKFAGGMERESKTLGGALSNLQDSVETLARGIGDAGLTRDLTILTQKLIGAGDGASESQLKLQLYYETTKALLGTLVDFGSAVIQVIMAPILTIGTAIGSAIRLVLAGVGTILQGTGAMIDKFTMGATDYRQRAADFTQRQIDQMVRNGQVGLQAWQNAGGAVGELFANAELRDERADHIRGRIAAAQNAPVVRRTGGLKETGTADAPGGNMAPGGSASAAAKKAEAERKRLHKASLDALTERSALLQEQIDLGHDLKATIAEALELEDELLRVSGRQADDGDAVKLLRARQALQEGRRGAGHLSGRERLEAGATRQAGANMAALGGAMSPDALGDLQNVTGIVDQGIITNLDKQLDGLARNGLANSNRMLHNLGKGLKGAVGEGARLDQVLGDITYGTLNAFGSAITGAFAAFVSETENAGQAFQKAMLGALGAVASGFGQFFMARATSELAAGIGAASNPLTAATAPGHFKAAAGWSAAGFAMFALAGALQGGAGRVGMSGGKDSKDAKASSDDLGGVKGDAVLVIEGGLLDMSDPKQEAAFAQALESLSGRRVTVKRRTG